MSAISVIIVNHNGKEDLGELFNSLDRQIRRADEVILVDNASIDGSVAFVREQFPWVNVIPLKRNVGFAAGNNEGVASARGDSIALLNPDTVVDDQWLAALTSALETDEKIAAVVPKIYRFAIPLTIEQAGTEFNDLGHCWTRGYNQPETGQLDAATEVPGVTGCSVLLRRSALHGERLFDPALFMYYEEFDLTIRLRGRGYKVVYAPGAIVYHKGMQSMKRSTRQSDLTQQFYCNRNRLKILFKYYPLGTLARKFPMIFLSVAYWNAVFLRSAGPKFVLRAVMNEMRFSLQGLSERRRVSGLDREYWLPWMTRHGFRDVLRLRESRGEM